MGNTLFDQLKKSGLVDNKKAKQIKQEQYQQGKKKKSKKKQHTTQGQKAAQQTHNQTVAKTKALNERRKKQAEERAITAQIKQLVANNRITPDKQAEIGFHFTDGAKVQRLYISAALQEQLVTGRIGIVKEDPGKETYALVPKETAEKIRARRQEAVLVLNTTSNEGSTDPDDPYAEYQVPDDLMW